MFYLISLLLVIVFGPFYSNYSTEQLEGYESNPFVQTYSLNFTTSQGYTLVAPTFLDWESVVAVNFNSTQPIYILVIEDSVLQLYEKSTFGNESGTLIYHVVEPANYTVTAEGFSGTANATVTILLSIVARSKPYAMWGQVMYFGGVGLLVISIAVIVVSYLRKEKPGVKQPPKVNVHKKT